MTAEASEGQRKLKTTDLKAESYFLHFLALWLNFFRQDDPPTVTRPWRDGAKLTELGGKGNWKPETGD